jgi:hypothetical protein
VKCYCSSRFIHNILAIARRQYRGNKNCTPYFDKELDRHKFGDGDVDNTKMETTDVSCDELGRTKLAQFSLMAQCSFYP